MALTTTYELRTFADIVAAAMEEMGFQSTDTVSKNRIKRDINITYLNEVIPYDQWKWLRNSVTLEHQAKFASGTASVIQNSVAVTLTLAPSTSRTGDSFSIDGQSEIYKILSHTAGSTSLVLDVPVISATNPTVGYRIWSDAIPLPVDLRDTVSVTLDYHNEPLDNVGLQQFKRVRATAPKSENRPKYYTTSDYVDPSPFSTIPGLPSVLTTSSDGLVKTINFASSITDFLRVGDRIRVLGGEHYTFNGEFIVSSATGSILTYTGLGALARAALSDAALTLQVENVEGAEERYKELLVYPGIYSTRCILHVDYTREVAPLIDDTDEPLMPLSDRTVLLYGTLMRSWARARNPEEAQRNAGLYERKLSKMAGKLDDSTDYPVLKPNRTYLAGKRNGARTRKMLYRYGGDAGGGSSGSGNVIGTANTVAVFDANGNLVGSLVVSVDELNELDGVVSQVLGKDDAGEFTNKDIDADQNSIVNIDNDEIKSNAAIALTKLAPTTPDQILISDGSGFIVASGTAASALDILGPFVELDTVALNDNQSSPAEAFIYAALFEANFVEYLITRGSGNREVGTLMLATDGTSVNMTQVTSQLGSVGVALSVSIAGGVISVNYTSTNTGTAPTISYTQRRWG